MKRLKRLFRGLSLARGVARLLRPHASGSFPALAGIFAGSVALVAFRLAQPWPIKWIIDRLSGHAAGPEFGLAALSSIYAALALGAGLLEYAQRRAVAGLAGRWVFGFRGALFGHVLALPASYAERRGSGELLTRVVYDTSRLRRGVSGILLRMAQTAFLGLATLAVLAWVSLPLAIPVLACGAVAVGTLLVGHRRILSASRGVRRREGQLASVVEEDLRGSREFRAAGLESDPRFDRRNARSLRGERRLASLEAALLFRVDVLIALAVCLTLALGSVRVEAGTLTAGALVLVVHYTLALYRPLAQFARQASQTGQTAACAERLIRLAERGAAVRSGPVDSGLLAGDVSLEGVASGVLKDVSFTVPAGTSVAVMGPNGAGKSTLLRLLARLEDPAEGIVRLDGRDLREYALNPYRRRLSVVHADPVIFGLTVRENVGLGRAEATEEALNDALAKAGALEFVARLRRGADTRLRRPRLLSLGERQRLALARAFLSDGRMWVLDEPMTGIDDASPLVEELMEARRGRTTFWATHDLATAMRMDRVLVLTGGRVSFFGSPGDLRSSLASA